SKSELSFTVNGKRFTVCEDVPIGTTLNAYIRDYCQLKGTKYMCYEGGCGSCVVSVVTKNAFTKQAKRYAVNSCLVLIHSCKGWAIETIEGIGNKKIGYHKLQMKLSQYNGTQCGYCSPGMVMNMYSISEGKNVTMKKVEDSFGGNICRCTGYRPILDAFKSVCVDAPPELRNKVQDIEDLHEIKMCKRFGMRCIIDCVNEECLEEDFVHWFKATQINDIFDIFKQIGNSTYMLVAGNTAHGVYRVREQPQVYIDVKDVPQLLSNSAFPTLKLGGNMSLADTIALFDEISKNNVNLSYTAILANHIRLIANPPVRNIGTLAGNLMTKYQHNEFPSDLFLIFETVGASLNIMSKQNTRKFSLLEFLDLDMRHKVILNVELPGILPSVSIKTYKIMIRAENAEAYVNAGFKFKFEQKSKCTAVSATHCHHQVSAVLQIHATQTENYLNGKNLFDGKVVQTALQTLQSELKPDFVLPSASPVYRKNLACALFYKFVLSLNPPGLSTKFVNGGQSIERPISSGKQNFDTDQQEWPLTKPLPKLEALAQCSGEAEYVNDIPPIPGETFAAFVITTVGQGCIASIDASEALEIPGVLKFLMADDIPGMNSFSTLSDSLFYIESHEEILCSGQVKYAGQPLGIIVAETNSLAIRATSKVKVKYIDVSVPNTSLRNVVASKDKSRIKWQAVPLHNGNTTMCLLPKEDGLDVFPSAQYMEYVQNAISQSLNIQASRINVQVRRLGGAYGAKLTHIAQVGAACALAACSLNRAVRFLMPLETNMEALGFRNRSAVNYEVGTDDTGKIQYLTCDFYTESGINYNEQMLIPLTGIFSNCYDNSTWKVTGLAVLTDIASTIWCRAPGSTQGFAAVEHIMEHIAKAVNKDSTEIRLLNMKKDTTDIQQLIKDIKISSQFDARKKSIDKFNKDNRWMKKGISLVPMTYELGYLIGYYAMVSIYGHDGSVAVVHGGTECGQGINTKVAQTVAHALGISLDLVSVKASNNLTSPNSQATAGSITSEASCYALGGPWDKLLKRMEPVKKTLTNPTWAELVNKSMLEGIDLNASHMKGALSPHETYPYGDEIAKAYNVYGVVVSEIQLDVLTGRHQLRMVTMVADTSVLINPYIDIGQIEGAFIMGLGYWLKENIVLDPKSGQNLTNRTWNYKPPLSKDIPIDFRVELRKNAWNPIGLTRSK
ncbi:hypothetical protein L9F63_021063, partial [Diploptera punctata]